MSIENFTKRVSVRDFDKKALTAKELEIIKEVINNSPTSANEQQFSAIIIEDQEIKDFIASINFGQKHISDASALIVFVADRTSLLYLMEKNHSDQSEISRKNDFFRSMTDAVIAATYTQDALIDMGFGITWVGGVINSGDKVAARLNVPESAFPVACLSLGRATKVNDFKPKMNKVFMNQYSKSVKIEDTENYIKDTKAYFENRKSQTWEESTLGLMKYQDFENGGEFLLRKLKEFK